VQSSPASVATSRLSGLAEALRVVDAHADLNRRYRKLIDDSRQALDGSEIRLTQARGIAKKLLVLTKAAGEDLLTGLSQQERDRLDTGLAQARELISEPQ
jgi:hypothetical protein